MSSIISKLINLAGNITGVLGVANGGTGVSTSTGTTNVVLSNNPTLVIPILGTPQSGDLTNCTNYPIPITRSAFTASGATPTNGQYGNATSISLTTGSYMLFGGLTNTRVSGQNQTYFALSVNTGNTTTDQVLGVNEVVYSEGAANYDMASLAVTGWPVTVVGTTTYFAKVKQDAGTFAPNNWDGHITAWKIGP